MRITGLIELTASVGLLLLKDIHGAAVFIEISLFVIK